MAVPLIHARNSAQRFGGKPEDYIDIHELIDSSGTAFPDVRHRALTHNAWFIKTIIPRVFGEIRTNSEGKEYPTALVAQWHVIEDYDNRFIPSVQDFLSLLPFAFWMDGGKNGTRPPSNMGMPDSPEPAEPDIFVMPPIEMPGTPVEIHPPSEPPREPARGCSGGPPGRFD